MAAVSAPAEVVAEALGGTAGVWFANLNAPHQTVIAGRSDTLDAALQVLEARGLAGKAASP
jgi:acyl transferase domain-containing protein